MQDKLSPRPSPQHSKSLTAPLDCTNCSKQHSNPINNFMSKWKYKEDLAKPQNTKRTRPRKQPQTTYHFPLSHCSVSTFNPNNKQNEANDTTSPTTDSSTESPETTPRSDCSPRSDASRSDSSPCSSPRQVSREILFNHKRATRLQESERYKRRHHHDEDDAEDEEEAEEEAINEFQPSPRDHHHHHQFDVQLNVEQAPSQSGIHHTPSSITLPPSSYKKKRLYSSSSSTPDYNNKKPSSIEISTICSPTFDSPRSPTSSDDSNDSCNEHVPFEGNCNLRCSKKRRSSSLVSVFETIEISDSESDSATPISPHSPSFSRTSPLRPPPPVPLLSNCLPSPRADPPPPSNGGYRHHPLSLTSTHNDLAKYHLAAPARKSPSVPPLAIGRLPSIDELPFFPWPRDDSNPRLHYENIRMHPRSQSFPATHL